MFNFSTDWFLTTQGILVTCGVVLLIIVLIILLTSTGRKKKELKAKEQPVQPVSAIPEPLPTQTPVVEPVYPTQQEVTEQPVNTVQVPVESVAQAQPIQQNVSVEATPVPIQEAPVVPNVVIPDIEPEVKPVEEVVEPVVVAQVSTQEQVIPTITPEQPHQPIYGGVSPESVVQPVEEHKPVIYGGANPLENTTTIPTLNHQNAYNGVRPVDTIKPVEQPIEQPVVAPTPAPASVPEPIAFDAPVSSIPIEVTQPIIEEPDTTDSGSDEIETLEL